MIKARRVTFRVCTIVFLALSVMLVVVFLPARLKAPAAAQQSTVITPDIPSIPPGQAYRQTNLLSDIPGFGAIQDPFLVNPWGVTLTASSPFWVSNNGTSTTQLFRGDVSGSPFALNPNPQTITIAGGLPTGVVANATTDFTFTPPGGVAGPARFIFVSITGNIVAWQPALGTTTQIVKSNPGPHVYTGLAIGSNAAGNRLYAANFASPTLAGSIEVFDGTFTATTVAGGFLDPTVTSDYRPFNIQNLGGSLYVTYAKVGPDGRSQNGAGLGFVRKFNTDGVRDVTFAINSGGALDSPWGMTIAPASFGLFGGALLVGNFSNNGIINAYAPFTGAFLGTLKNEAGNNIVNDELWALTFGNGGSGGDPGTLYFSAGTAAEEHGLFGSLKPTTATATSLVQFATDEVVISEGGGHVDITVTRAGDVSGSATVNFDTFDASQAGHASQKSDYEIALGKLTFNPGETSKTFRVLIIDDKFVEGTEEIDLALSNPTGSGVGLGSPSVAHINITDNDSVPSATNPIDDPAFFVRQQYLDFLNREPDQSGATFWTNQITSCGSDATCIAQKRINTSGAFFLSNEFQNTGMVVLLANKAAFGPSAFGLPSSVPYGEFERGDQALQKDLVFGQPNFDSQLDANKQAYFADFVNRPDFKDRYDNLTNAQYVDALLANEGLSPSDFTVNLSNSQEVPPTNPTTSGGAARPRSFGTARFQINAAETAINMTATISNIDVNGTQTADTNDNLIAAHIHAGASVQPGVNGGVVWGFFGSPFNDNNPDDHVLTPTAGGVGGTFTDKWDSPEGNGTTLAAQLPNIRAGRAYINFHTTQYGGGEIRGNFPATQVFRDSLVSSLNAATDTRAIVLRKIAESVDATNFEFNRAFVIMQYFGYLRRDADVAGFNFWLNKLNSFGGNFTTAEMVKAFITSSEYRQRFGGS
jgi:uncharacterized protein (TIGR03118 family)